ncbi:MAG TPA: alpha-amylase family glycosyl hydrolase [Lacibacter sp.]|mgnify:CR=1 FL=1|nr:alpha-amylase family glycosyl hydrolase [Lacibacter sp.]HMO89525.1 alpha-amylase family glycosyl hydrolase [Lacibacter sp.]HMP86018.1 alpha-amylase family glycosyl hydrolase [Lacibacter sp.]
MTTTVRPAPWVASTNIYEVNLRQYTPEGTFAAFARHLPRLQAMGVEVIWLMPVTPISVLNRKGSLGSYYACSSYVQTNPEFGTLDEFRQLVQQIRSLGMKVIIDWVANHTGWDHEWTLTHPDYYNRNADGSFRPPVENWEDVIHLNFNNPALRRAMTDAMRFWVEDCGIDGFRCDMAMLVPVDFWEAARRELDQLKPLFWLGEFDQWGDEPYAQVFDVSYSWHWMHSTQEFYRHHRNLHELDRALTGYQQKKPYHHIRSFFTTNHDENSWNGTEYEKYGPMALPLAVFSCTWNGIPLLYSGQELPNHRRLHFFDKDEIEWTDAPELHLFYKTLLEFRKQHPALRAGHPEVITWRVATNHLNRVFSFLRKAGQREVLVLLNFSEEQLRVDVSDQRVRGTFTDLFSGEAVEMTGHRQLKPWGYAVLYK